MVPQRIMWPFKPSKCLTHFNPYAGSSQTYMTTEKKITFKENIPFLSSDLGSCALSEHGRRTALSQSRTDDKQLVYDSFCLQVHTYIHKRREAA